MDKEKLNTADNKALSQTSVSGSSLQNPYKLVWYRSGWSKSKIKNNNYKYWEWEVIHNGFKLS